jgi:hypothetical protein
MHNEKLLGKATEEGGRKKQMVLEDEKFEKEKDERTGTKERGGREE